MLPSTCSPAIRGALTPVPIGHFMFQNYVLVIQDDQAIQQLLQIKNTGRQLANTQSIAPISARGHMGTRRILDNIQIVSVERGVVLRFGVAELPRDQDA